MPIPAPPDLSWLQEDLIAEVRAGLDRRRWTQAQLAEEAGISAKHLSQIMTGKVQGTITMWAVLLDAVLNLGVGGYPVATFHVSPEPRR